VSGKGDHPRPVDPERYRANYERIFRDPPPDPTRQREPQPARLPGDRYGDRR